MISKLLAAGRVTVFAGAMAFAATLAIAAEETPYVPTPQVVVDTMLKMAKPRAGEHLIDLGSGDGRIVITAAKQYGVTGFGVDHDPRLVQFATRLAQDQRVAQRVKFSREDLFLTDLRRANILTMYLLPDVNMELRPRIWEQLRPGTRIVTHDYDFGDWRPNDKVVIPVPNKPVGPLKQSTVFLFVMPAKVAGTWEGTIGQGKAKRVLVLNFGQNFNDLTANGVLVSEPVSISDPKIDANRLAFEIQLDGQSYKFAGTVAGEQLTGEMRGAKTRWPFRAKRTGAA